VRVPWPLFAVLAVQAALSASMVRGSTAFGDEALYLSAGHLEWSHWLHGTQIPMYQTWFSGAPVIYPPIGAIADSLGGLAAARLLSLVFMLGVTSFLWSTARRLLADKRAAFFAAALFAVLAPTLHLGSFATYDALALLLLTAATWCAAGVRGQSAARWIIAAGILLALANATKYATALYDPTVVCVIILSSWPDAGWKVGLRRAAFLAGVVVAVLAVLLALGGSGYLTGIRLTTTGRVHGTDTASLVFADAWSWTAVVVVPAVIAAVVCAVRRQWQQTLMLAVLALSALLAPADQARLQTATSLDKHVDFGAWFAAIAAGYLLRILSRRRVVVLAVWLAAWIPVTSTDTAQAHAMIDWPDVTGLIKVVRPMTAHGGRFLVETTDILQYYLPNTTWRQWSSTQNTNPEYYQQAIARHYFSVVVLSFNQTLAMDYAIALDLSKSSEYQLAAKVSSGKTVFYVWRYVGRM
jgi:hypothetical protein